MPTVGAFHQKYWRAKANAPPPPAVEGGGGYPLWQSSIVTASVVFGPPLDLLGAIGSRGWAFCRRRWWRTQAILRFVRHRVQVQARLIAWIWRGETLDAEQFAVMQAVLTALQSPAWRPARVAVRDCAGALNFSDPKMWQTYSRALRDDAGQAQNIYRHLKVVLALRAVLPLLENPETHLLAELAYQGFRSTGHRPARIIAHPVLHYRAVPH